MGIDLSHFDIIRITAGTYEVYRQFCKIQDPNSEDLPIWDDLNEVLQAIAIDATEGIIRRNYNAITSHAEWVVRKQKEGWVYGGVKDVANKKHPGLVQFLYLPAEQQIRDRLWVSVVKTILQARNVRM